MTSPTIAISIRASARSRTSTVARRGPRARPQGHPRFRAESQLGPAPLVRREPDLADQPEARLVHLARSGAAGGPPNNWISDFGGSAWEWDEATGQYYYHAFLKEQPDLDWRNPAVQQAMYDVLRFWFARGVDGFRIDVLWHLIKAEDFPDNPPNPAYRASMGEMHRVLQLHSTDQPEVHDIAAEMRRIADAYGERVLIGEIYLPLERLMHYYGRETAGVHLPFNFQLVEAPWNARGLAAMIAEYEAALPLGGWPNWVLGNHDRPRIAARLGEAQARVAAMLLLTLRGTPTLYYGDELGIGHVEIPRAGAGSTRAARAGPRPRPRSGAHADAVGRDSERRLHHRHAVASAERRLARAQRRNARRRCHGRCSCSTATCSRSAARTARCRSATSRCSMPRATSSPMSVATATNGC